MTMRMLPILTLLLWVSATNAQTVWTEQTREVYTGTNWAGSASAFSIATNPVGDFFVCGDYGGEIEFDTASLPDDFGSTFLAKYTSGGSFSWIMKISGNSNNHAEAVALNDSGHVYVTGSYRQTNSLTILDVGGLQLNGNPSPSLFLAKVDTSGNPIWVVNALAEDASGTQYVEPRDMKVAPNGDIVIVGEMQGFAEIEGQQYNTNLPGKFMAFMARFHPDGTLAWFRTTTLTNPSDIGSAAFHNLAIGSQGQLYVNGSFGNEPLWGNTTLTGPEGGDQFLARFTGSGDLEWYRTMSSRSANQYPAEIGVDAQDNVYLTMRFGGAIFFQDVNFFPPADLKGRYLLLKYNAAGDRQWYRDFAHGEFASTGGIEDQTLRLHTDASGQTLLMGRYAGFGTTMVFGEQDTFPMPDDPSFETEFSFATILDVEGNYIDAGFFIDEYLTDGSTNTEDFRTHAFTRDAAGMIVLTGDFRGVFRLGADTLQTQSSLKQMQLVKLDPAQLFDRTTSISQNVWQEAALYPNPARDRIYLQAAVPPQTPMQLYSLQGQLVRKGTVAEGLRVNNLPAGVYVVQFPAELGILPAKVRVE